MVNNLSDEIEGYLKQ